MFKIVNKNVKKNICLLFLFSFFKKKKEKIEGS